MAPVSFELFLATDASFSFLLFPYLLLCLTSHCLAWFFFFLPTAPSYPRARAQARGDDAPSADQYVVDGRRFSGTELFAAPASADAAGALPGGRNRLPWRTIAVAAVLFAVGLTFLLLGGLHFWCVGWEEGRVCRGGDGHAHQCRAVANASSACRMHTQGGPLTTPCRDLPVH